MTTLKGVGRLYDQLGPEERFKLAMAAAARGDEAENDRLIRTCPRVPYRLTDPAFHGRCMAAYMLVAAFEGGIVFYLGWLAAFDALAEPLGAAIEVLVGPEANGRENGDILLYSPRCLAIARKVIAGNVRALWDGFGACCREEVGVEAETLIRAFYPPLMKQLDHFRDDIDVAEADPAQFAKHRDRFGQLWRKSLREES